jgi:hypothetical protein
MRVGQNPAKFIDQVPQPARVTVALVSYIPFLGGYYAESLDVLKASLNSIWENTSPPYDLLVFDNASCPEVRTYLMEAHQQGRIQYLLLSEQNVGKGGAWNFIFQGAPGQVVAYADSDVYFFPGWLQKSLDLLDAFPRVGMVSSRPLRTPEKYYSATLEWARSEPGAKLEQGQFQSWEVFKQHNDSLGVSEEQAHEWFNSSHDWRIEYGGRTAFIGAAHFQFIAHKTVLLSMAPLKMDRPMGQVRSLDQKLNEEGYLRLTTCEALVEHLGNRLSNRANGVPDRQLAAVEIKPAQSGAGGPTRGYPFSHMKRRFFDLPPIRRLLLILYDQIFRLYFSPRQ